MSSISSELSFNKEECSVNKLNLSAYNSLANSSTFSNFSLFASELKKS